MSAIHIFTAGGVPVFVSMWYFLLLAYYAWASGSLVEGLLFGACVTVSLLVHEFGHALVARHFGLGPKVLLHGWGGLCAHDKAERDRDDALIIAAGPGAGLLLGLVTWVVAWVSGVREPGTAGGGGLAASIVGYLLWINVVWSFVNLLPLWPLDGGQLFRLGMLRLTKPARAEQVAFSVGAGLAGLGAVLSYRAGFVFFTVICALLAWENIQRLMDGRAGGAIRTGHQVIHGLLREARAALEAGDPREAARLTHQVRAEDSVHRGLLPEIWSILAVATVALGEHDEALAYIKRAPRTPEVVAAAIRCYAALGEPESARAELADPAFRKLPVPVQMELRGLIDRS